MIHLYNYLLTNVRYPFSQLYLILYMFANKSVLKRLKISDNTI